MNLRLLKDSSLNVVGQIVPMLIGVLTIPRFIHGLGDERFSLLTIAWTALGYFSLFDFGFGRATTKLTAERLFARDEARVASLFWTSMSSLLVLGIVGTTFLVVIEPWLLGALNELSPAFRDEASRSLLVLILTLPFIILTANARGVMEAQGKFVGVNVLQLITGSLSFLVPIAFLGTAKPLLNVVTALALIRIANLLAHLALNFRSLSCLHGRPTWRRSDFNELWSFGGWLTVSNVVGPVLYYFDRFLLGAFIPVRNVGFYTTPLELVTKFWLLPSSLTRALFPQIAVDLQTNLHRIKKDLSRAVVILGLAALIPCGVCVIAAEPLLRIWIGAEFAAQSKACLSILAAGIFVNSLAWVPFMLLQNLNQTKLLALIHLWEVPFYGAAFFFLVSRFGIVGAAWAWTARVAVDAVLMFYFADRKLGEHIRGMESSRA